jgi:hypothetical protein
MNKLMPLVGEFVLNLMLGTLVLLPIIILGWALYRRKRKFRAATLDPFTDMPLRPPGESTRQKIETLQEEFDEHVTVLFMVSFMGFALNFLFGGKHQPWAALAALAVVSGLVLLRGRKIFALQQQRWDYRLGFTGERVVGEALNQLQADGFLVFHDLPFDGFNIDHVIVGPPGVFAIETKTRRKPAQLKGSARATVVFDGKSLHYPGRNPESHGLEQAARNAKTLSLWLVKSTGEQVSAQPVLALPGWWVERRAAGPVNVLNPKEIRRSFTFRPELALKPDQIQRIAHQLTERCRLARPD